MSSSPSRPLLFGVDGGATTCKLVEVVRLPGGRLGAGERRARREWAGRELAGRAGFAPVPLDRQLAELEGGALDRADAEIAEGRAWVATLADVLAGAAASAPAAPVRVGIAMPGRKTADGRGVAVLASGPRMPRLVDELEAELARRGVALAAPLGRLCSDGDAAGWGEELAPAGAFRGVASAYYAGCGTGVAEALKLDGTCRDVGELRAVLPAPWRAVAGQSQERALSLRALHRALHGELAGELTGETGVTVDVAAREGSALARALLARWSRALAAFLVARLAALWAWEERTVDRVVVGQRSGDLLADPTLEGLVRVPFERALEAGLAGRQDGGMRARYLDGGPLVPGLVVASTLRDAPAIGAVAATLGLVPGRAPG